jgi:hypothetical protein
MSASPPTFADELNAAFESYGVSGESRRLVLDQTLDLLRAFKRLGDIGDQLEAEGIARAGFSKELQTVLVMAQLSAVASITH